MTDFQNKVIIIVSKEEKKTKTGTNTTISIKDQDKVTYVFWKTKKDGALSEAMAQFKNMQLDEGSVVQVSWVAEEYTGSDAKQHTSNKVTGFRETNEQPVTGQIAPQTSKSAPTAPITYSSDNSTTPDWNGIAIGKTQSLFLAAYIQSGKTFGEALLQVGQARRLAEMVVAGDKQTDDVPPPQVAPPEVPGEDIPF